MAATFRASSTALRKRGEIPIRAILSLWPCLLHQLDAEILGFARHHHRVRGAADEHLEMGGGERLREVVPGAGPQRLDAAGDAGVAGHHHHDGVLVRAQRGLQDLQPGDLGHVQVDQNDVELAPLDRLDGLLASADDGHVVAVHLQHAGAALPQGPLVVHHEDPDAGLYLARDRQRIARRLRSRSARLVGLREHVGHQDSTKRGHAGTPRAGCRHRDARRQRIDLSAVWSVRFLQQCAAGVKQVRG